MKNKGTIVKITDLFGKYTIYKCMHCGHVIDETVNIKFCKNCGCEFVGTKDLTDEKRGD